MAVLDTLINLFPGVTASLQIVKDLAVLGGGVVLTGIGVAWFKRFQLRQAVILEARGRGLSIDSAELLARCLWREGPELTRDLMRSTDSMRARLASELGSFRHTDAAERFAVRAARIMEELRVRGASYEGAPLLFEKVVLTDPMQEQIDTRTAWVVEIDDEDIHLVCAESCNWPVRHDLHLARSEAEQNPMLVNLLLRPMPGNREWVVSHDFASSGVDRRHAVRRDCNIEAWTLPTTAGAYTLRGRLQDGAALEPCNLEKLEAWPRRQRVIIQDISCDGARLSVDHPVTRGDHFYLVLSQPDGAVSALPLTEVVSVRDDEQGLTILGTRFCAVRLKERVVIADYAEDSADAELSPG